MGGGGVFKKTDSGFGAGVRPTAGLMNSPDNLISQGRTIPFTWKPGDSGMHPSARVGSSTRWDDGSLTIGRMQGSSGIHPGEGYNQNDRSWVDPADRRGGKPWMKNEEVANAWNDNFSGLGTSGSGAGLRKYNATDVSEAQGIHDRAEERRQEKLDAMSELAQGKGGSGGGVSGQIVGDGGDLNIQQVAMNRGKDGFPTLADFEQPLHPFMGKRKLNLKGYV